MSTLLSHESRTVRRCNESKWMRIFKRWFNRKSNFYCQVQLNNNYLYAFGHREKVVLFVCLFCSKMRAKKCFFNPFAQLVFVVPRQ